jgi:YegS/Rv2252/BmrU family lipid kinase
MATVIINPISGTGGRPEVARRRAEMAARWTAERGIDADIVVTERPGHARDLARAAVGRGADLVVAWGGDGTMNEVASQLAFTDVALGMMPSGSGNGLARELGLPLDPSAALEVAFGSSERVIDAGELDGHLFFNVAGIGLDARVAHRFAQNGLVRRGFARYLEIALLELFAYRPDEHTLTFDDGETLRERTLLIAIANGRQYGNNARIAPHARVDDGRLDVVVVADRRFAEALVQLPRLFNGTVDRARGVISRTVGSVEITSAHPVIFHVDGEPVVGSARITARARPCALRVRVSPVKS